MKKSRFYIVSFVVLVVCCQTGIGLYSLLMPAVHQDGGFVYYLKPGTSKKVMIADLSRQGVIRHPLLFSLYVYPQINKRLKTGEYLFPKGSSLGSIWKQITNGTGLFYHSFTIVPGWSFNQLKLKLSQATGLRHITAKLDGKQIMSHLGNPELASEGEFFPETYYYTRGNPDLVILKRAFDLMQNRLNDAWQHRAPGLPYKNKYEALIAASLVEKEAYLNEERTVIAGVLINRLHKDMLLQFDPTVIYGMGERYNGKIQKENLAEDTAYNTYVHKGLPPTPIAMPSMMSIEAALHPQVNDYYYFVARGDGSHQFSKSLSEHNVAVSKAVKYQSVKRL